MTAAAAASVVHSSIGATYIRTRHDAAVFGCALQKGGLLYRCTAVPTAVEFFRFFPNIQYITPVVFLSHGRAYSRPRGHNMA